ncbi:helix-turn-helix domain-containing protein [Massilioclostridium coli]|uniref:helix-turn-helix domain-containing protein n=1 Tax=Massilioclostridium coli TaxID=1870991 RepID=UPI0022E96AAE|nr:AraC family transcriptional regulator [Massilioclostridium coli]
MYIDHLIASEREKVLHLSFSDSVIKKHRQQLNEYGFFTVSIENEQNPMNNGLSIILHGPPVKTKHAPVFHNHDYYEMVYVYRGGCVNTFRDHEVILSQGDILLLNPNVLHCLHTLHEQDCVFNIMLSRSLFEESMLLLLSDNKLFSNFIVSYMYQINTSQEFLYFPAQQDGQVDDIVTNLIYEVRERSSSGNGNVIQYLLAVLFTLLARIHAEENNINAETQPKIASLLDIISYINQNSNTVNLSVLEERFSYSSGYISRMIKQHCGQSFTQLVQNAKLQHAREILKTTDTSIVEVAEESGFQDSQYFSKLFKEKFGLTPRQYRKMCQESIVSSF